MNDYEPRAIREQLATRGWVVVASGPDDTQRAVGLLRKRVYGAARCLGYKASTTVRFGQVIGWLRYN